MIQGRVEVHDLSPDRLEQLLGGFDGALSVDDFTSPKFTYRVIFVPKTVNHPGQADQIVKFVEADSAVAQQVDATYAVVKEPEKPKRLPSELVRKMKAEGSPRFGMPQHTELWKSRDAKNPAKGFGVASGKTWSWYDPWFEEVRKHCRENKELFQ